MDYDFSTLITEAQSGDKEALEQIIKKNEKLIYFFTNRINVQYNNKEDINQIGFIGLIKAIQSFSSSKNFKFSTYAARCIKNEIFMSLDKNKNHYMEVSINQTVLNSESGDKVELLDMLKSPSKDTECESLMDLNNAMKKLNSSDRGIIEMIYFKNMTQQQVAKALGVSRPTMIAKLQRALSSIKFNMMVI